LQAAKLLCSFREYHRRASFGLSAYYGQKLAALEDALLNAREALFSAQQEPQEQQQQQLQEDQQLKVCVRTVTQLAAATAAAAVDTLKARQSLRAKLLLAGVMSVRFLPAAVGGSRRGRA
jgi:hypothetical protein